MKNALFGLVAFGFLSPCVQADLSPGERQITLMATNDLHGSMENLGMYSGHVKAVQKGLELRYGGKAATLLLDGGDQFQGTLTSNYDEGASIFKALNQIGYDAVVPGNHDYDFGPEGWLEDRVSERTVDKNPRGAFQKLISSAKFSVLSANVYYKNSFFDYTGKPIAVDGVGCNTTGEVDWSKVIRAEFVKAYKIFERAGVRIAVVGLDHSRTPTTTTEVNVSDLCFDDEARTYARVVNEIKDKADLFVIVLHNGDVPDYSGNKNGPLEYKSEDATNIIKRIQELGSPLHAVIAGHTHQDNRRWIEGVPLVQSHSDGTAFGRIDLVFDTEKKSIVRSKTKLYSSIPIKMKKCPKYKPEFCSEEGPPGAAPQVLIEGQLLVEDADVIAIAQAAIKNVAPIANVPVAEAPKGMDRNRYKESPLADWLTDVLRFATNTEIAFMNTGGIRANLGKGKITYEDLFQVLPFNNRAVTLQPLNGEALEQLLAHSIQSCGKFGSLMQSGLKVEFTRDCSKGDLDPNAKITKVTTLGGKVLLDVAQGITAIDRSLKFKIATLDFLISGKSEFGNFGDPAVTKEMNDFGIAREVIIDYLKSHSSDLSIYPDGRWKDVSNSR